MHVQEALQAFLIQLEADGRSPHTIGQYRRHGLAFAAWLAAHGDRPVADLKPDDLARFFADDAAKQSCRGGRKKAGSLNAMRTSLRCFCAHLHNAGLVAANPARLLRRARCAPPPPRALHADEQSRLRDVVAPGSGAAAARDRMLIELLLGTGVRIGSALALDVQDVDFAHSELLLRTTKNDRPTTAVMPAAVAGQLREYLAGRTDGPVFQVNGRRLAARHAQRRLSGWLAKAGIQGRSAHSLRHTFAADLLARTGDLRLVQAALNHASIVSTTIYTSVDRARVRAVVGG